MLRCVTLLALIIVAVAYNEAGVAPDGNLDRAEETSRSEIDANAVESATLQCLNATNCDSCLQQPNCGWCQGKKCVPGALSGPYTGTCDLWSYNYCPNQNICQHSTCVDCLNDADCGWCSTDHHCLPGNSTQPLEGSCSSSSYYYTSCPGQHSQSVETDISFPFNGRSDCIVCAGYGMYICCNGYSVQSNSTLFFDPTPAGSTITQVKINVVGVYTQSSLAYTLVYNFNNASDLAMPIAVPANTPGNSCGATCETYGGETKEFQQGVPGYNKGGYNFIGWLDCGVNYNCFSEIQVTVVYTDAGQADPQAVKVTVGGNK